MPFDNGVSAVDIPGVRWIKSTASQGTGNCVEVADLKDGSVAFRNSRFPQGPALVYTESEVAAFVAGVKAGEFDDLTA
ncbi:DUF397 domain-containing protein [Streptomyces sp. AK02-01A]|uniref:DUF397 domain-containing protein n=1 Tax=Streptomyces sp. AK02-01A TaxID=3028648 RepID=UPI0029B307E9|nr:DUF397 domain-containing protein [Streptomyces sp. AK02-01A]MDX3855926.1 DUF397 domain-containing protein [Streptomyces sp. AK02-01A]